MKLLQRAVQEIGVKEQSGEDHNSQILQYAQEAGFEWIADDETPWCSVFVNWCCIKEDLPHSGRADARSWLNVGKPVNDPQPGDIVVFWRESRESWKGHVGFFFGFTASGSELFCLGGNQRDSVSIQKYDAGKVLGFRRVSQVLEIPKPPLVLWSRNKEVVKLQHILNEFNYPVGAADGVLGPKTMKALSNFQRSVDITPSDKYEKSTQLAIEKILLKQS